MTDIIDKIDQLIDQQLDAGEPRTGYDYGDPAFPKCPHCQRDWHGLRITERMERMRWRNSYDEDYSYAEDDSRVLCPGSDFIGPVPLEPHPYDGVTAWDIRHGSWEINRSSWFSGYTIEELREIIGARYHYMPAQPQRREVQFSINLGVDVDAPWVAARDSQRTTVWTDNYRYVMDVVPTRQVR